MRVFELVAAGILVLGGARSLLSWLQTEFEAASMGEQVLYALHATSRVGTWFALAGFFVGYAFLDEPRRFAWYFLVPISLAGVQLLTGLLLSRGPSVAPNQEEGAGRGSNRARDGGRGRSNRARDGETLSP